MADPVIKIGWKLVGGLPASLAANAARKAVTKGWERSTGAPAADPHNPGTPLAKAMLWSVLSGAGVGLVELLVTRRAAATWRRATGDLPPGFDGPGTPAGATPPAGIR